MTTFNTIVISDLHLGEDLSPKATEATRQHITHVEENLVQFLRHKARRRQDGRPWRLVINGDMIDFMGVIVFPEVGQKASRDEHRFGLKRRPAVAVKQVEKVATRHAEFFSALARFAGRGNCIEIVAGNHDTELQFPQVQRVLREAITAAWRLLPESKRTGALTADQVGGAIDFHRWFFHEPGVSWIEHGHQYDECCSYEFQLYPRAAGSNDIMLNVDTAGCRYVTNYVAEADPHQQEEWDFGGYIRFATRLGLRKALRLAYGYSMFAIKLLGAFRRYANARRDRNRAAEVHRRRLAKLATESDIESRTLMSIDNLRRRPVVRHLRRLSAVVMVDKLFFFGLAILVAALCAVVLTLPWKAVGMVAPFVFAYGLTKWSGRNRIIDASMGLQLASERIHKTLGGKAAPRAVVFGHTHNPIDRDLGDGRHYFNTGTWVPTAKPGILGSFTHVVIRPGATSGDEPHMGLYRWSAGASVRIAPVVANTPGRAETSKSLAPLGSAIKAA